MYNFPGWCQGNKCHEYAVSVCLIKDLVANSKESSTSSAKILRDTLRLTDYYSEAFLCVIL